MKAYSRNDTFRGVTEVQMIYSCGFLQGEGASVVIIVVCNTKKVMIVKSYK